MKEGWIKTLLRNGFSQCLRRCHGMGLGRLPFLRFMEHALRSRLKGQTAVVLGHTMQLDAGDILDLSIYGVYEPLETEFLQAQVSAGDVVVDIGAHIGYYTLLFAKLVGPQGKVFAFEPDPTNFAILSRNVAANGYANVVLVPKAVSDTTGVATLYLSGSNSGDHRLYPSETDRTAIKVVTTSLDDYFGDYAEPIAFVKLDIQGAEYAAVSGMSRVLQRNGVVRLMTEFWPNGLRAYGVDPGTYLRLLVSEGFCLFYVDERRARLVPVDMDELVSTYTGGRRTTTNLLCLKDGGQWR